MTELYNSIFEWEVAATSFSDNSTVRTGLGLGTYMYNQHNKDKDDIHVSN